MKIKKIEIAGFKSFVDPSVVVFDHDVTGIVGPNGCGKSNIVDAIRWVMGEQSAKNLRGRAMEDIIFNGSESRGPHGFAEVALTFDNADGLTPPEYRDYPEITVTRRLDRQGRSDYLINRTAVRLLDVTNLFLGTGVGKRAYSIIEQGRIGFIVSSKPVDRRHLIDEAAGVTKFKARKRAAERKMEHTRGNLHRVTDIVQEIERSLASLKRQAQKAERYRRYRDELRGLELHVATHKYFDLTAQHGFVHGALGSVGAEVEGQRAAMRFREAECDAERSALAQLESQVERRQQDAFEQENAVQLLEAQMDRARERIRALETAESKLLRDHQELKLQGEDVAEELEKAQARLASSEGMEADAQAVLAGAQQELEAKRSVAKEEEQSLLALRETLADKARVVARKEAELAEMARRRDDERHRLEALQGELEAVRDRRTELGHEERELVARLAALREGRDRTTAERQGVEEELGTLRREISESDGVIDSLREGLSERRSRLRSLREIQERFEGVTGGARELMKRSDGGEDQDAEPSPSILGLLVDRIECPEPWTAALAAVLGHRFQHVVVADADAGLRALNYLRENNLGRATVLPQDRLSETSLQEGQPTALVPNVTLLEREGVIGPFADHIELRPEDEAFLRPLLAEVLVVADLAVAVALQQEGWWQGAFVTQTGAMLHADGALTGGAGEDVGAHLLSMKRELRGLEGAVAQLSSEFEVAQERHGSLRTRIASRQASIEAARAETHDTELSIVTAEKDLKRIHDESAQAVTREERLGESIESLQQQLAEQAEETEAHRAIEEARAAEQHVASEIVGAETRLEDRRGVADAQGERVTELRVEAAQATERAEAERLTVTRLAHTLDDVRARGSRVDKELSEGAKEQGASLGELLRLADSQESRRQTAAESAVALRTLRETYDAARERTQLLDVALRELRTVLEEGGASLNDLALRERELALALQHLEEQVIERYRSPVQEHLVDYHDHPPVTETELQRIEELNRLIDRMGDINLTAIEEYEENAKRHEYLSSQQKDLEDALDQLDKAIRQMNRESRRLFQEAFEAVNERFQRVFPAMFGGGRAELRLTEAENLLEAGVEIIAQPPGKRLGSLELMSGGEKALTAVSLIFAIFQYRPSPFCLLDEVDAPLDEANIGRFSEAVRAMTDRSQFILITHAKKTMEAADVLYGVTMEEPGVSKLVSVEIKDRTRARSQASNVAVA